MKRVEASSKPAAKPARKGLPKHPAPKHSNIDQLFFERSKRQLIRSALRPNEQRDLAFRRMVLSIPAGKVSTYGAVAAAAGYPRYHRAVARLLRTDPPDTLPWHRVLGAGGEIKLRGAAAHEQRARLKLEGVEFVSARADARLDMARFEHALKPWEVWDARLQP